MNHLSLLSLVGLAALLGLNSCSSEPCPCEQPTPFETNSQTIESVFRAFEAEEREAFWDAFAETAVWRGTGVNAPTTLSRHQMEEKYDALWEEFDYRIVGDLVFRPGLHPETQQPNGSVNGEFLWEVSRVDSDGRKRSVQLWIYESFDFNEEGQIVFTHVFSDLASAYRQLRETSDE